MNDTDDIDDREETTVWLYVILSCLGLVKLVFANAFSTDDLLSHSLISSASGAPVRVIVIINL
jgi:hypothetical protein